MSQQQVSLIGAPTDVGAGTLGARLEPEALRVAGIVAGSVPATRASGAWDNAQALAGMSGYGLAAFFKEA